MMSMQIEHEAQALKAMTVTQLQKRYGAVFGEQTRSNHKAYLWKRIVWRMQVLAEGDISESARQRARELACDGDLRLTAPKDFQPMPPAPTEPALTVVGTLETKTDHRLPIAGAQVVRRYQGRDIIVTVLDDGFLYGGQRFRSLSAIAKTVTGTNWNGFDFFGLKKQGGKR